MIVFGANSQASPELEQSPHNPHGSPGTTEHLNTSAAPQVGAGLSPAECDLCFKRTISTTHHYKHRQMAVISWKKTEMISGVDVVYCLKRWRNMRKQTCSPQLTSFHKEQDPGGIEMSAFISLCGGGGATHKILGHGLTLTDIN